MPPECGALSTNTPKVGGDPYTPTLGRSAQLPPMQRKVNGTPNMKRHHQRQAQQLLTLSLMGSLALLAACGGGGKGTAAPVAAVAASAVASEPTLLEVTDPNEPYLVSASSTVSEIASKTKYQLNIIDGGTQAVRQKISLTLPLEGHWFTVNRIEKNVDKGPSTLYYVNETPKLINPADPSMGFRQHPGGQVFQVDLRRGSDLALKAISGVFHACYIKDHYNQEQDGSKTALILTTAGPDEECGNANGTKTEKDQTTDNQDVVIVTDDAGGTPEVPGKVGITGVPATASSPEVLAVAAVPTIPEVPGKAPSVPAISSKDYTVTVLQYLYQNSGSLTGVLVERKAKKDPTSAQLFVLSPSLDKILTATGVTFTGGATDFTSYTVNTTKPEVGVQWIARAPSSYSNGYLRLQDTTATTPFNRLYKFTWDNSTATAKVELDNTRILKAGTVSTPAVTDDQYIYYVDGQALVYGPTAETELPFQTRNLKFTDYTDPVNEVLQTPSSVIVVQKSGAMTHVFAISKKTGTAQEITSAPSNKFKLLGVRGDTVYVAQDTNVFSFSATVPWDSTDIKKNFQTLTRGVLVQMSVKDNTRVYDASPLSSLVTCVPTDLLGDSCRNSTLKVFDLEKAAFTKELGSMTIADSDQVTVSTTSDPLAATNNVFQVTKTLPDGATKRVDPWLFHPKAAQSLTFIETLKTTSSSK
ncbi:MAG: hypothetical protein KGL57_08430 [Burkholderiales bacterium]|nr:hypothetical protein [Burkholderiales bacterium]